MTYSRAIQKHYDFLLLAVALILGGILLFFNLHGAVYLNEDEARPFTLMSSGQLMYLMNSLANPRFSPEDSAFYFAAGLSFLSIVLFYGVGRISFGRHIAAWAALVYAVHPLRIEYARTLFPAVFMEPYALLAILFCYLGISRRQSWWMLGAGASLAAAFLVHYMAYVLILGLTAVSVYFLLIRRENFSARFVFFFFLKFASGFLGVFFTMIQILKKVYQQDYFSLLRGYYDSLPSHKVEFQALTYLKDLFLRTTGSASSFLITAVVAASVLWMAILFFKKRSFPHGFFLILTFVAAGFFMWMALLGKHSIYDRYLVWMVLFYSLCVGVTVSWALDFLGRRGRWILTLLFFAWVGICIFESNRIVHETFSLDPVRAWIRENQIPKNLILTNWHIREAGDTKARSMIPVSAAGSERSGDPVWFLHVKPRIAWPVIYRAYQKGLCGYILTSGLDDLYVDLGDKDTMLKNVKPLKVWPHPYSAMPHRSFYRPGTLYELRCYKLSDVFSRENFLAMKQSPPPGMAERV